MGGFSAIWRRRGREEEKESKKEMERLHSHMSNTGYERAMAQVKTNDKQAEKYTHLRMHASTNTHVRICTHTGAHSYVGAQLG